MQDTERKRGRRSRASSRLRVHPSFDLSGDGGPEIAFLMRPLNLRELTTCVSRRGTNTSILQTERFGRVPITGQNPAFPAPCLDVRTGQKVTGNIVDLKSTMTSTNDRFSICSQLLGSSIIRKPPAQTSSIPFVQTLLQNCPAYSNL